MDKILPRKYNNPVTIGLAVALLVAVGIAIYYMTRGDSPTVQKQPTQHAYPAQAEHFETKVSDVTNKPTLLLIWADWCGHSVNMKPTWDKVASILNQGGVIEAVDLESKANANDIDKLRPSIPDFQGFPHIRFYPDGYGVNSRSVSYKGARTEEDLLKFAYTTK